MKKTLMKNVMTRLAGSVGIVLLATAVFGSPPVLAGISNTKHNLGSEGLFTNKSTGTAELCVFCHTPHGADTTAAVPLWNRVLGTQTYQTYNSLGTSSLDGATAPVGSVSLACLSCHDGTQALNVMINAPGSGGYNSAGAAFGTMAGTNQSGGVLVGVANLGTDLRNDHPIGIQYGGGPKTGTVPSAGSTYDATMFRDADFAATTSSSLNGSSVWWVNAGASGTAAREKSDMQLYTRTGATGVGTGGATLTGAQPFVECATCHDPHSEIPVFLRISNDGSRVCLACHIK